MRMIFSHASREPCSRRTDSSWGRRVGGPIVGAWVGERAGRGKMQAGRGAGARALATAPPRERRGAGRGAPWRTACVFVSIDIRLPAMSEPKTLRTVCGGEGERSTRGRSSGRSTLAARACVR